MVWMACRYQRPFGISTTLPPLQMNRAEMGMARGQGEFKQTVSKWSPLRLIRIRIAPPQSDQMIVLPVTFADFLSMDNGRNPVTFDSRQPTPPKTHEPIFSSPCCNRIGDCVVWHYEESWQWNGCGYEEIFFCSDIGGGFADAWPED